MATVTEELIVLFKSVGAGAVGGELERMSLGAGAAGKASKAAAAEHAGFGAALKSVGGIAKASAATIGISLAVGIGESVKKAQEMQANLVQLSGAIKNNVKNPAEDATEQMHKFADSLAMKGGFAPSDTILSMTKLLGVTKDVGKTEKDMALASDIARRTHLGLGRATRAVMMVEAGRTTGLSRMGIFLGKITPHMNALNAAHARAVEAVKKHNDAVKAQHLSLAAFGQTVPKITQAQKDQAKAQDAVASRTKGMAALWQQFGGATSKYSHTSAGAVNNLKNTVDILEERLGAKLLPIVNKVAGAFTKFVDQLMSGKGFGGEVAKVVSDLADALWKTLKFLEPLLPLVLALGAAWAAYSAYTKIAAAIELIMNLSFMQSIALGISMEGVLGGLKVAWGLLNVTVADNPFIAIGIAIVALIAIFILLYKHCKWFRDLVKDMGRIAAAAFHWFLGAVKDAWEWIKGHWPLVAGILFGPIGWAIAEIIKHWKSIEKLPGKLLKLFKDIGNDIANAIVWPFKWAFHWVSKHLPSFHTHHIGPIPIPLPSFPGLAGGGVTPYGGAFVVGERGPELVTLPQGAGVSSQDDLKQTNMLLRELILAVRQNSQALVVDGKVLAQSVMRQGLIQQSRA